MNNELTPFGFEISSNEDGLVSLTDIWKQAGSTVNKDPKFWLRLDSTVVLVDAMTTMLKVSQNHLIKIKVGKGGGSYAHKNLALSYAKWLDPKIAIAVNQIFFERIEEEKNPELAIERAKTTWRKQGKSEKWINMRIASIEERKSFTSALKQHGVTGHGYKDCTNAIYKPLWGGDADLIRAKKNIPEGSNCRDYMTEIELAGVRLAELLAEEKMEAEGQMGNKRAEQICEAASQNIARAIRI